MDMPALRRMIRSLILDLKDSYTHTELPEVCETLGLPIPDGEGSKRQRLQRAIDSVPDCQLPDVANRLLESFPPNKRLRNIIQDILWEDTTYPPILKRFRRELADALTPEDLYIDAARFDELLDSLWLLDTGDPIDAFFGTNSSKSLRAEIDQHVHRNPADWDVVYLFDRLGAIDASNQRFALFLEGLASADVRPYEPDQRRFVNLVNSILLSCGIELRETGNDGGYPLFSLVPIRSLSAGHPKNLIFASSSKPDIRFRDAINNDIEIASHADEVLVYDRPIPTDGLLWNDLQRWWADTHTISDPEEAKKSLYFRLRDSLPNNSPPQRNLFEQYFRSFGSAIPSLPALLPEVWLHWDPKTVQDRGPDALLRFRMDFLLLLPHGVRVVLEVDGKQHYADQLGQACPSNYAKMALSDRELKLAAYEVFRFGASGLVADGWQNEVDSFFRTLFKNFSVPTLGV